ncbi:MAG: rhodanese-like domain-containing protein [Candidatus Bathyarchaeota archaeon]|nr:rhodanese-like domain-containing protein [Candidatus Bathyarchaeota archaeon]
MLPHALSTSTKEARAPLVDLGSSSIDINKDKELIVFCMASLRAYEAQLILKSKGYSDVKFLDSGVIAWPFYL